MPNRLQYETSPYLLQHANNPVDWYPWGEEALQRAKTENKPILISIGYSTCHWCHVMERESFEDARIARFMNEHFINIKIDREERPDLDDFYMEAVQLIQNGQGGWPLNCFLLPDTKPFFGGTYFPPQPAHGRPSWAQVLQHMRNLFTKQREDIETQATRVLEHINSSASYFLSTLKPQEAPEQACTNADIQEIYTQLHSQFDTEHGGWGGAPKFPGVMALRFLLNYVLENPSDKEAETQLLRSADAFVQGGIYDQLGGGFARYTVDEAWLVPHFEKMLYDNALIVEWLCEVHSHYPKTIYQEAIEDTLAFIEREMYSAEGLFYAALDADTEGEEGKFYVWSKTEIEQILGTAKAAHFCAFYKVTEKGNWEGNTILHRTQTLEDYANTHNLNVDTLRQTFAAQREALFAARAARTAPGLDDKVLLSWNALMINAYVRAAQIFGHTHYKAVALRAAQALKTHMKQDTATYRYFHSYKEGQAKQEAFLEDYALLQEAWLNLYALTFDSQWLEEAKRIQTGLDADFWQEKEGLYAYVSRQQKDAPLLNRMPIYDNATPSGNSTLVHNLHKLSIIYGEAAYATRAEQMCIRVKESILKYPRSFGRWANAAYALYKGWREIAVVGADFEEKATTLQAKYLPFSFIMAAATSEERFPLLHGREGTADARIFLCENYQCQRPVYTVADFYKLLE